MATPPGPIERDDILIGTDKKDRLYGFGGDDKLYGKGGKDLLNGGYGDDLLRGDKAGGPSHADTFVFGENSGKDVILDFDVGRDIIEIYRGVNDIRKPGDVIDHARQKGKDVVIDLGDGNKITLKNVDLDDLKKNPGDHFEITKNLSG